MSSNGEPTDLIGVDVGGTKALGVRLRPGPGPGGIVDRVELPSAAAGPDVVEVVARVVDRLVPDTVGAPPRALGVGLAGFVDGDGIVRAAPNAAGLVDVDVVAALRSRTGLDAVVDNDANCVAVAAHEWSDPPVDDLVAVTLGTGIGGGIIVDGRLLRGARGFAGEPGHAVVDPDGPVCPCGQRGCWERFASGSALRDAIDSAVRAGDLDDSAVPGRTGVELAAAVRAEVPGAGEVLDAFAARVALGVAGLVAVLDPAVVAIGGGLSAMGRELVDTVRRQLELRHRAVLLSPAPRIELAPFGPDAGAVGAAVLAGRRIALRGG